MNAANINTEKLFSYGTLQYEAVQISTFGRKLIGVPDTLIGYRLSQLQINDTNVIATSGDSIHPILLHTGNSSDRVTGIIFDITSDELQLADKYEVADYKRIYVELNSGAQAWVYIGTHVLPDNRKL